MTQKSTRILVSMATSVLFTIAYCVYAVSESAPTAADLKGWAKVMLVSICILVAAQILVHILFTLFYGIALSIRHQPDSDNLVERTLANAEVDDEMDQWISLKAEKVGGICAAAGFLIALIALALGAATLTALHILLCSFFIGMLVGEGLRVFFYERGLIHG